MRRLACYVGGMLLALGGAQPLAAQFDPLGPMRQWTFNECREGDIPNATRTGLIGGQVFCVDGLLTLGATPPRPGMNPANPGATEAYLFWRAELRETVSPGVGLSPDLDREPYLRYTLNGVQDLERTEFSSTRALNGPTRTLPIFECAGLGCPLPTTAFGSLDRYAPTLLFLPYTYTMDVPCSVSQSGCRDTGGPPQIGILITNFQLVTVTPEPSTYALLGTGLLTLGTIAVRRRKRAES